MKLDDLQAMIEKDSVIELVNLSTHSIEVPKISARYQMLLMDYLRVQKQIEFSMHKVKKDLVEYYKGYADDSVYESKPLNRKPAASEVETYIKADNEWQVIAAKFEHITMKIKIVEEFIKQLNQRSFMIKNAIDYEKFKNGGF